MKFDNPAGKNPIDRMKVVGKAYNRIDGPLKTTGQAPYAYERHDVAEGQLYGYILGSAIAKGRIKSMDLTDAQNAPGVKGVVSTLDHDPMKSNFNTASLFGGPQIQHYHQAIAMVMAETFEQARAAAALIRVDYAREDGRFDLEALAPSAPPADGKEVSYGDFDAAWASAPVKHEARYTTPAESHSMMEPHATIAAWKKTDDGRDHVTIWTSNQMIQWNKMALAGVLGIEQDQVRVDSPFLGGGFGSKLFLRADAVVAALGAKQVGQPVKVMLQRPLIFNNTTHRAATIQSISLGAEKDGKLTAIRHISTNGNLPGGDTEGSTAQTQFLYASPNRYTNLHLAEMDLPEANAMRAPGEAPGMMALEMAMDELAETLDMCPVKLRVINDTQVDPTKPSRPFSERHLVECLQQGAAKFGWPEGGKYPKPGGKRDGEWLTGIGMAAGFRDNLLMKSAARVRLKPGGRLVVETDMTDIGTGSYTILAQTAAEMMGLPLEAVEVTLGDSDFPASAGSGGQWGANNSTAGVYAACVKLREMAADKVGFNAADVDFDEGEIRSGGNAVALSDAAADGELVAEDGIEYGDIGERYKQSTFAGHFVEVAVNAYTGESRIKRMLAVCSAGRILNPKSARSQVIGAMTMGAGAALMEDMAVDTRFGFFVNHDLAGYEVPVHLDIPHQEVVFLDEVDEKSSPMKAKGVGELGLCGVGAAIANAIYNATGVRVRDYPITLDKHLEKLPAIA
ncbi:aldehyde oxidoreductase molybdenum-binding subunit PaoC [Croceicoccus mobilis]|uniref:Oxidoreductase n=1 Tax=Croceicoccus mobilis TaxID=1703339 RepID=A0A917DSL2_9SPHN|nr:aldehyde oxidoreductase molybdenum-binding subunit PaoC [Croceicoccus mobilis]GGD63117.1 oxidoreductase [Croceicoccus mobilis]